MQFIVRGRPFHDVDGAVYRSGEHVELPKEVGDYYKFKLCPAADHDHSKPAKQPAKKAAKAPVAAKKASEDKPEPKKPEVAEKAPEAPAKPVEKMRKAELIKHLEEKGEPVDKKASVVELRAQVKLGL